MFSELPVMISEIRANGTVSGNASRIVIGCTHDSNCAARIRYIKIMDSRNAVPNAVKVFHALLGIYNVLGS